MWSANAAAAARAAAAEQAESAERARTALALMLADQVARGCDQDSLIVEEYREAVRRHHETGGRTVDLYDLGAGQLATAAVSA